MYHKKNIIVTGAGSGIGQALAVQLAAKGANLILVDISQKGLEETKTIIDEGNYSVRTYVVDLGIKEQVYTFVGEVLDNYSTIDFLFNIAGVAAEGTFEEISVETLERVMNVNFYSQMYLLKAFLPYMRKEQKTYIINMSSLNGQVAFPGQSGYSASKFAIRGLSHVLYYELENTNIQVSVVISGAVSTNITKNGIPLKNKGATKDRSSIQKGILAKEAAEQILSGVEKGERDIIIGEDAKKVLSLAHIFPIEYWSMIEGHVHM